MGSTKRRVEDWLKGYLTLTKDTESPDVFHMWNGLSSIAATLERNVYLDRGFWKLYSNLYVILVSASAVDRRTTSINISSDLVREACPTINFIAQKLTTEALIKALQDEHKEHGVGAGYILAEELSVFLGRGIENASLIQLLTKAYGCPTVLDYHTRGRGIETANNACLNLLGSSAPEWISDSLPGHAIAGGFAGRIIFVHPAQVERKRIAFPKVTQEMILMRDDLVEDLKVMRTLKGEYTLTESAKKWYETWYEEVFQPEDKDVSLQGYYARKQDTVLKVGMILSASRNGTMTVTEKDVEMAVRLLNETEKTLPSIMRKVGSTQVGDDLDKVLNTIKRKAGITYSNILRNVSYRLTASQVQEIINNLLQSGLIDEKVVDGKKGKGRVRCFQVKG